MAEYQDYFDNDDRNEGHVDTRQQNFECDTPDPHLREGGRQRLVDRIELVAIVRHDAAFDRLFQPDPLEYRRFVERCRRVRVVFEELRIAGPESDDLPPGRLLNRRSWTRRISPDSGAKRWAGLRCWTTDRGRRSGRI